MNINWYFLLPAAADDNSGLLHINASAQPLPLADANASRPHKSLALDAGQLRAVASTLLVFQEIY